MTEPVISDDLKEGIVIQLGEAQRTFTRNVAHLIDWCYASGYELTLGEAYRTPQQAQWNADNGTGVKNSVHCLRLAIDLNLFKGGQYQPDSEAYRPLGDFWKGLDAGNRWGGDFTRKDGNHFSYTYGGVS